MAIGGASDFYGPRVRDSAVGEMVEEVVSDGCRPQRPLKIRPAGKFMVSLLGLFNVNLREFKEMMYEFEEPYVVDHSQYQAVFGNGATPHEAAIAETVAWYRAAS